MYREGAGLYQPRRHRPPMGPYAVPKWFSVVAEFYIPVRETKPCPSKNKPARPSLHCSSKITRPQRQVLPPSTMIHSILPVRFVCLTLFLHNLSPSPLGSTSESETLQFTIHTFLHTIIIFFSQHMSIPLFFNSLLTHCRPALGTLSKSFSKTTNQKYSFFSLTLNSPASVIQ